MTRAVVQVPHEGRRVRCVSRATGRGRRSAGTLADTANRVQKAPSGTRLRGQWQRPPCAPARRPGTGQSGRSTATHAPPPRRPHLRPLLQGFRGRRERGPCPGLPGGTTRVVAGLRWPSGSARCSSSATVSWENSSQRAVCHLRVSPSVSVGSRGQCCDAQAPPSRSPALLV